MNDGWTWVSLSAYSEDLTSDQIRQVFPGAATERHNPHMASVRFKGPGPRASLAELLQELAEYLGSQGEELQARLGQADFQLRIGWSPQSPQECIAIPSTLLSALARLRVDLMLDAYSDEQGEVPA
jgi:hypothetical protein